MAVVHAHDPGFYICCGIEGCPRTYSNFYSFKKHLYRKHRCNLEMDAFESNPLSDNTDDNQVEFEELEIPYDEEPQISSNFQHMKRMALFLLKTKEIRKVSQAALDGLIADFTTILQQTIHQVEYEVDAVLKENGVSISAFQGLRSVFNNSQTNEPFKQLHCKFLQEKFYREHFHMLVS